MKNRFIHEIKNIYDTNDRVSLLEAQVKELQETLSAILEAIKEENEHDE